MQKIIIVSAIAVAIFFSSCMNEEQQKQMGKIDSLRITLDTVSQNFNSVDSAEVAKYFNQVLSNNDAFDSVPEGNKDKDLISRHRETERNLRRYMASYDRINNKLEKSYNQLDSLAYDVKNDLIPEGKFDSYLQDEKQAINRLQDMTNYVVETSKKELGRRDSLQNAVEKYLEENSPKEKE